MAYNKEELMNLPVEEKLELVEALWDRIDDDLLPVTQEEIAFAEERLQLHNQNPAGGMSWGELKKKIQERYGF
ncbi:MAG: addiction module protein [Ginsengibacter sp.]